MSGKLTYKQSGVDTKEAAAFVSDISSHVKRTQKQRSLHQAFGLFAAAYDLSSYKEPVIVTGCDGVGTKTEILFELDMVETAGKDLVAMNVNDILTTGGAPLLFLDYLGISNLERERSRITRLVAGMCDYLESCNCILAGGETAEMPGVVPESIVELSGFCIGCCEKSKLIDPKTVRPGDVFIGYKSDSFHANGDQSRSGKSNFTYRPFTLEGNMAFASSLQEMLLQSHTGTVRIFPAIPPSWKDVSFRTLRTEGAFLVSAAMRDGKVSEVKVCSTVGGPLRVLNTFSRPIEAKGVVCPPGEVFEANLTPGEELTLL
jgi:hypothetical protein